MIYEFIYLNFDILVVVMMTHESTLQSQTQKVPHIFSSM